MILCVGTSHRFVSVGVLEHATREAAFLRAGFEASFTRGEPAFPFAELAVLSTCNRVELYAACADRDATRALALLQTVFASEPTRSYTHRGIDAVTHLCRVAAGLDSLVLGEPQIAGQVAQAFENVTRSVAGSGVLPAIAGFARKVSRRARAETGIARGPVSLSSVAIKLAGEQLRGLGNRNILVLGAGKISRATCEVLRTSGAHITVANRTLVHAEALARKVGARAVPLFPLAPLLADAHAVITSTASPVALIDSQVVRDALARRVAATRLLLIDIAVPCNVAADVRAMGQVDVVGIDDLHTRVSAHLDERRAEVPAVEAVIAEEIARLTGASAVPV